jgi:hypothetical protein
MEPRVNTIFDPTPEAEVECACIRCRRQFGDYILVTQDDGSTLPFDPAGHPWFPKDLPPALQLLQRPDWEPRLPSTRRPGNPRVGTGLHIERFGDRTYVRVICKCGRNEKLGSRKLHETLFDDEGLLRLRDGVLYL